MHLPQKRTKYKIKTLIDNSLCCVTRPKYLPNKFVFGQNINSRLNLIIAITTNQKIAQFDNSKNDIANQKMKIKISKTILIIQKTNCKKCFIPPNSVSTCQEVVAQTKQLVEK